MCMNRWLGRQTDEGKEEVGEERMKRGGGKMAESKSKREC